MIQNGHGSFVWRLPCVRVRISLGCPPLNQTGAAPTDDDRNQREAALKKLSKDAVAAGQ